MEEDVEKGRKGESVKKENNIKQKKEKKIKNSKNISHFPGTTYQCIYIYEPINYRVYTTKIVVL